MPRLFVVFRTFDRIWSCKTYTREAAPFVFDESNGDIKLMFCIDHIIFKRKNSSLFVTSQETNCDSSFSNDSVFFTPHKHFKPCIVPLEDYDDDNHTFPCVNDYTNTRNTLRRYSLPSETDSLNQSSNGSNESTFFVLPRYKCTLLVDAHLASALSHQLSSSQSYRKRFLRHLRKQGGYRDCAPDYLAWTEEERQQWEAYLSLPYMVDVVTVWPAQRLDQAWGDRLECLIKKYMALEEGFAWLSTLGGAHSALGETFTQHAERAGAISRQQLSLALQLGHPAMAARCFVFWAWSLLQTGHLDKGKLCIRMVWHFAGSLRPRDTVLERMCQAVWSRLLYRRSLRKRRNRKPPKVSSCGSGDSDSDSNDHKGRGMFLNSHSEHDNISKSKGRLTQCTRRQKSTQELCSNRIKKSAVMRDLSPVQVY